MDLSGYSFMDLDQDSVVDANGSGMECDHVKWQGSQTANHALNQLIRSSVNDPVLAKAKENVDVKGSCSRGWQREPSFDQIPGFSLLSTKDSSGDPASSSISPSAFQTTGTSSGKSQSSSSSRLTIARPRHSEMKSSRPSSALAGPSNAPLPPTPTSSLSSTLTIPFFDKTNPSQFLDILKGVSARVDANAGVRPRNSTGGLDTPSSRIVKGKKRPRGVSMGGTPDALAARMKKGRIESLRDSAGANLKAKDKGKGRMRSEVEDNGAVSVDSGSAQENVGESAGKSSLRGREEPNGMEVDEWSTTDTPDHPRDCNSSSTSSQKRMPPPPAPVPVIKQANAVPSRAPPFSSSSTSSSFAPAIPRPPSLSHSSRVQSDVTSKDIKFSTTSQTPKYHPLLLQPPTKPVPSASSSRARQLNPQPKRPPTHVPVASAQLNSEQSIHPKIKLEPQEEPPVPPPAPSQTSKLQRSLTVAPPSSSPSSVPLPPSTSQIPSSQSSRPPALGMRRTHTLPTIQKNGVLPTKQKGFKPPLLSSSQPQPPSRSQLSNASAHAPVATTATITRTNERIGGGKTGIPSSKQSYNNSVSEAPPSSNGSTSSASDYSRRGAVGPPSSSLSRSTTDSPASSFTNFPPSSSKSRAHTVQASGGGNANANNDFPERDGTMVGSPTYATARDNSHATKAQSPPLPEVVAPKILPASPPLPEPADGDADSSFGDMSFDLDALEETMRQYD